MSIKRLGRQKGNDYPAGLNLAKYGSYQVTKSLRFRNSASAYLSRTPSSTGNRRTWTYSVWFKRGLFNTAKTFNLFTAYVGSGSSIDTIDLYQDNIRFFFNGSSSSYLVTSQVFRDPSAWYHLVASVDTTQATASNRMKLYINGTQITTFSSSTYPTQNYDTFVNLASYPEIIGNSGFSSDYYDGYMTEAILVDGQALTPSSFGATDPTTGQWQPVAYTGTYGTNGFYLPFTDTTSLFTLGNDPGNGNNWTLNNFSLTAGSTYDSMNDVPTLTSATQANYCTLNPLHNAGTLTNANLNWSGSNQATHGTIASNAGKYYFEVKLDTYSSGNAYIGISEDAWKGVNGDWPWEQVFAYVTNGNAGGNGSSYAYGATYTQGDTIGVAFDITGNTITFYKNGTSQGVAFTTGLLGKNWRPFVYISASSAFTANFGQRAFAYTPPTGYVALNTYNLPDPTIKVGNKHFAVSTYTGTGAAQQINSGLDLSNGGMVWTKTRSNVVNHDLRSSGLKNNYSFLQTNSTNSENNTATQYATSFNSTGYTIDSYGDNINQNTYTFVSWQWKAGAAANNTNGTITSQVFANPTAGFSIVSYTGNDTSGATVGHGLSTTPSMFIVKTKSQARGWNVYHTSLGNTKYIQLQQTGAAVTSSAWWNNTSPSSTTFTLGNDPDVNSSTQNYMAYCFAPVDGYSSFGSYAGNSSTDGTFVYTGFKPKFIMVKEYASTGGSWHMFDTARNTYNVMTNFIYADSSAAETTDSAYLVDFVSNGFKFRGAGGGINYSGRTYIYAAFAEYPFKNGNAAIYNIN